MTPVEERIDHEEAKRIAERHLATLHINSPDCPTCSLARAYLDLLTEHSAREEALRKALDAAMQYVDPKDLDWIEKLALPATEPAQPYPEGGLPHGEHPYDYGYEPAQPEEESNG